MAFLHTQSCECMKSELSLFDIPPTQTTIEGSNWVQYKPISSLTNDSPIEFVIPGNGDDYIDLTHTLLNLRVTLKCNTNVKEFPQGVTQEIVNNNIGPVNNFMHSMFSQLDVFFNQKPVSPPNNAYAYRAYIETLLNYGPAAKNSHLSSVLWYDDTAGKMDDTKDENKGLQKRRECLGVGKTIDMIGHLHSDVFNQEKLLLNGVEVRVRMVRSRDTFSLMDTYGYFSIHIEEANLLVRRVKINPGVLLAHAKMLSKTTAKYPLTRVEVKAITLNNRVLSQTLDNIILGQVPKRIIIGFVQNQAYNGDRKRNPFNFQHFNINSLTLFVDGVQVPSKTLQPDFANKKLYVDAYHTLFSGTGIHFLNEGNQITRENYPDGFCLFAFDLTPDLSANECSHWNFIRHGSVRLDVRFDNALTDTVNCIVYAEYDNILEIDASRQVIVDYGG